MESPQTKGSQVRTSHCSRRGQIGQAAGETLVVLSAFLALVRPALHAQDLLSSSAYRPGPERQLYADIDSIVSVHPLLVGEPRSAKPTYSWSSPITNLPVDWIAAGSEVMNAKSVPTFLAVGATTGALLLTDHATYRLSRTFYQEHSFVQHMSDALVYVGEGSTHLGIAAGFGLYGFLADDNRAMETGGQIVEALVATGITVQLLKRISGRESPQTALHGTSRWRPFPSLAGYQRNQPKYYSFPSGHIATTMATLTVIAENYPDAHWIRPVGYGVLAAVGVSLVNVRYHWFSDLPLGLLLGYGFGELASHHSTRDNSADPESESHVIVHPTVGHDGAGLAVAWSF